MNITGNDDDLEYFVREAGDILGVTSQLELSKRDGKHILEYIFRKVRGGYKLITTLQLLVRL
jgi:hypothetical protein